ncbi:MAG: SDR family NAD(P)-dependent oxidoreductase, partial [Candidatus Dormibacteraeota bacterium]|nr:SDR family NAD(P)-dependent oxidoreductase [Candidatus Dormibacteraeota bacterium]MBO0760003.1 SDR family NAD(P)-dependent oxidoreductase [Candidatus Dormibacteraeota bacterium]
MASELDGRVILITGATDGLGRGVARELAAAGATVLLHGRDAERGRAVREEIGRETGSDRLGWYQADLSSLDEVRDLAARVEREQPRLHVLVNNAGIGTAAPGDGRRV